MRPATLASLALLLALVAVAGLYAWDPELYLRARIAAGLKPFPPFLDLHNVMAAIECWHRGVDVYVATPCDIMGRPHIYSPLWLRLPAALARSELTLIFGLALAVAFILSLLVLPAPEGRWARVVLVLAAVSPDTVFALERANMDVLIFVVVALAARWLGGGLRARIGAYALFLAVGLLKFYPLVLLGLLVRERPRVAAALVVAAMALVALAVLPLAGEFGRALANILPHPHFTGTFGARQLAAGLALLHPEGAAVPTLLGLALAAVALVAALRLAADARLVGAVGALPRRHADLLLVGGALVVGCFLAGQNVEYRAVFLLMALPALLWLGQANMLLRATTVIVVWLLWDPLVRRLVARLAPAEGDVPGLPGLALWTLRELLWWWVVAVLAGLLAAVLRRAPAGQRASGLSASQSA